MAGAASEWRAFSRPTLDYGTGGEQIARAAYLQIVANLPAMCEQVNSLWMARDQDFAAALEVSYQRTSINIPHKSSIFLGAQPSLVIGPGARFDRWPAITVRSDVREPSRDQADQFDIMSVALVIEVLAAAGPWKVDPVEDRATSDQIDRQYQRLSEAVIACINVDRSLDGNCLPIELPPRMIPSLPMVKKLKDGAGPFSLYQGAELTWIVTTQSRVPGL